MMNTELLRRGLGAQRRGALIWGAALFVLTVSVVAIWPSMNESGSLDTLVADMSPTLISALGLESLASPAGFLNGNLYALLLPLLFAALGIMHMNALTAGDEDAGRLELLVALPVSRVSIYLSRFVSVVLVLAAVALLVGLTVGFGGAAFDMELDTMGVVAATVNVFLLALFHAALALALAGLGLRTGAVLAGSFGVLILGYLVYALFPLIESLESVSKGSPWHWALGGQPLETGFDAAGTALLICGTVVLTAVGLLAVRRRTIRTA
ncbi:ABC transporter permease subunit [Leucobacter denitrificans]|uniref:ABC transporter permease subunit n=1 Tax=Leucobacter denitrificans TaxID=683042 RepID=A0A7G9S2E3_9MICO|nr:ABC transporter permease subunit [Leucobacter denitrificans]QNN62018.1 ABC transporter permease subunit [Leucobacter denitrificans]